MSEAGKGKQRRLGHQFSDGQRAKMSASMRGIKKSAEHVEKIRQRMLGTSYAKGRIVTDEERERRGKRVIELTTGLEFATIVLAAAHFGLERANVVRALRWDRPLRRGPHKGLHFRYDVAPSP